MRLKKLHILVILFGSLLLLITIKLNNIKRRAEKKVEKHHGIRNVNIGNDDIYCDNVGDWLSFEHATFFKKSASYYFFDLNLIYLNILHLDGLEQPRYEFILTVVSNSIRSKSFRIKSTHVQFLDIFSFYNPYKLVTIKIDFKLDQEVAANIGKSVKMSLQVVNLDLNQTLRHPLELKIKRGRYKHSKTKLKSKSREKEEEKILVCSKVMFINDENGFRNFKAWTYLNKIVGYHKLVVYNLPDFREEVEMKKKRFFQQNKEFIEVRQMTCLPNLIAQSIRERKYFKYYFEAKRYNKQLSDLYEALDYVSFVQINECYLDHMDEYRYIAVEDFDEVIMPSVGHQFTFDTFKSSEVVRYLSELENFNQPDWNKTSIVKRTKLAIDVAKNDENKSRPRTVHCTYAMYLRNSQMDKFCRAFQTHLGSPFVFLFDDNFDGTLFGYNRFQMSIDPANREEFEYAIFLCEINKNFVQRLLKKLEWSNRSSVSSENFLFNRFFSIYTPRSGKSLHDTTEIFSVGTHDPALRYFYDERNQKVDLNMAKRKSCGQECCYATHFRTRPIIFPPRFMSIKEIYFDSFYFNAIYTNIDDFL